MRSAKQIVKQLEAELAEARDVLIEATLDYENLPPDMARAASDYREKRSRLAKATEEKP
jgi:predicted transcriptional regulator